MKEHPDRQPRGAVTMHCRNDDDGDADQNFECDWVDGRVLKIIWIKRSLIDLSVQPAEHADLRRTQRFEPAVDQIILSRGRARNLCRLVNY